MEHKALLSTNILPNMPAHIAAPAFVAESVASQVQLYGGLGNGYGGVAPLGFVQGNLNLARKTLTLFNGLGTLEVHLSQFHHHRFTTIGRAWQIVGGTGLYANLEGSGPGVFTITSVGGRVRAWSASFY